MSGGVSSKSWKRNQKYYFDARGYRIVAIMSGFQPENTGSAPKAHPPLAGIQSNK